MNTHYEKIGRFAPPPPGVLFRSFDDEHFGFTKARLRKPLTANFITFLKTTPERVPPLPRSKSLVATESSNTDPHVPIAQHKAFAVQSPIESRYHESVKPEMVVPPFFKLPTVNMRVAREEPATLFSKPDMKATKITVERVPGPSRFIRQKDFPIAHLSPNGEVASITFEKDPPPWIRNDRKNEQKKMRAREARDVRREFLAWEERERERQQRITLMREKVRAAIQREEERKLKKEARRKRRAFEVRKIARRERLAKQPAKSRVHEAVRHNLEDLKKAALYKAEIGKRAEALAVPGITLLASAGVSVKFLSELITIAPLSGATVFPFVAAAGLVASGVWLSVNVWRYQKTKMLHAYHSAAYKRGRGLLSAI